MDKIYLTVGKIVVAVVVADVAMRTSQHLVDGSKWTVGKVRSWRMKRAEAKQFGL